MLDRILAHKRTEIERLNLAELKAQAMDTPKPRAFLPSPQWGAGMGVRCESWPYLIAELKRASPSRGLLAPHLDLMRLAQIYAANGAAALSILTDEKFFLGHLDTLRALRHSPSPSGRPRSIPRSRSPERSEGEAERGGAGGEGEIPLLRKDFILSPAQVYETRAAGADALLLIAAALREAELSELHALALDLGLTPLVEVHCLEELECALRLPALKLVGINNRDLKTFNVNLDTTARLRPHIPPGITVVSESGIFTAAHAAQLAALNVDAILVGEALVTAPDIGAKVRELAGVETRHVASLRHGASLPPNTD